MPLPPREAYSGREVYLKPERKRERGREEVYISGTSNTRMSPAFTARHKTTRGIAARWRWTDRLERQIKDQG